MNSNNNAAKFAFFYMLSLVALLFMALSAGMIIFQIINKNIVDILNQYQGRFSPSQLKFAISALIISTPIFYITSRQIYKSLLAGILDKDSGIRKWLTYFILLVTSVTMLGWLIGVINTFLDGDLTTKFILKAITAIFIAAVIFTFYFYDIRREEVRKKNRIIQVYFYTSLIMIIAVFVASLFIVESPRQTRNRKIDEVILNNFNMIANDIDVYYGDYNKLPETLDELIAAYSYLIDKDLSDPLTGEKFEYRVIGDDTYELCANFRTSNKEDDNDKYGYYREYWSHEAGYQCLKQKARANDAKTPLRIRE